MGQAGNLFHSSSLESASLHSRITPTQEQRSFLQVNWRAMADAVAPRLNELSGMPVKTWIQGSYKFGTLIKPLSIREEYDVDLGVYFCWDDEETATPAPEQLKRWVQVALTEYLDECDAAKSISTPPKERCSRLNYTKQFHIDVPSYHLHEQSDKRRLATESKGWESSDPKAIYVWFKDKVETPDRDQLRRLIRYFKAWSAVTFLPSDAARPTSVLMTVLVTHAFVDLGIADLSLDDEDAFGVSAIEVFKRLEANRSVPNPVNEEEELNRIADDDWDVFLGEYAKLADAAGRAADAVDQPSAALIWADVFSYVFPLPDTEEVEIIDETSRSALMVVPNIRIDVTDKTSGRNRGTHQNELPSVMLDCNLKFTITNPEVVPRFATVEWTVRNAGDEAEKIGDLGHRTTAVGQFTNTEHTSYVGRHFMDCVIKHNGSVLAVRRIAVNIRNQALPPRNPPKRPAYTRISAMKRRR